MGIEGREGTGRTMGFLKLRCECAYATGAIHSNLSVRHLASKLTSAGLPARVEGGVLRVSCDGATFAFGEWADEGMGRIGWLQFTTEGDIGTLSRRLARLGIRHCFDLSRPADVGVDDVRCVTRFEHHWTTGKIGVHPAEMPQIHTYEEQL